MRKRTLVIPAAVLALVAPVGVAAQDATAGAGAAQSPISPNPAECQVAPRSAAALLALWYAPAAGTAAAGATAAPEAAAITGAVSVPVGPPADEATTEAVTATARELFACFAAGDTVRAYALFTDDLVREFVPEPGVTRAEAEALLTAPPEPEAEGGEIVAVASPMVLNDGRVGAFVVDRGAEGANAAYAIFERQGDAWLVDGLIEFGVGFDVAGDGGTPTP